MRIPNLPFSPIWKMCGFYAQSLRVNIHQWASRCPPGVFSTQARTWTCQIISTTVVFDAPSFPVLKRRVLDNCRVRKVVRKYGKEMTRPNRGSEFRNLASAAVTSREYLHEHVSLFVTKVHFTKKTGNFARFYWLVIWVFFLASPYFKLLKIFSCTHFLQLKPILLDNSYTLADWYKQHCSY